MWQQSFILTCCIILLADADVRALPKRTTSKDIRAKSPTALAAPTSTAPYAATAYDYDYDLAQARRTPWRYQKSNPSATTERPLIRYWNNFVRSIRLPVPTITWNMTNPLVNLFNAGGANVIESPIPIYETSVKRRRKNRRPHANIVVKRSKKRKRPQRIEQAADNEPEEDDTDTQSYAENLDANKPVYFYDANTGQYYEMQHFGAEHNAHSYKESDAAQQVDSADDDDNNDEDDSDNDDDDSDANNVSNAADNSNVNSSDEAKDFDADQPSTKEEVIVDAATVLKQTANKQINVKAVSAQNAISTVDESLRNVYGSYMSDDDHMNRKRQRANPKRKSTLREHTKFTKPRNTFRYYFLQAV